MKGSGGKSKSAPAAKRSRRWRLTAGLLFVALAVCVASNSCTSTITPPPKPAVPSSAYLLKSARHVGVVLPDTAGGFVEYGFGDWDWYASLHDSWFHVFDTVLWPTRGCLSRRALSNRRVEYLEECGRAWEIMVEHDDAADLLGDLDRSFDEQRSTLVHNELLGFEFVEAERAYWFPYNCNDAVTEWLERLGCDVSWVPIRLDLEMAD